MPDFTAEIEIEPYEYVNDCSLSEIKDLIEILHQDGLLKDYFQKNGSFQFMDDTILNDFRSKYKKFPVVYTGFGFMLVKRGVFESMKYPWFQPEFVNIRGSKDFTMEDVAWCREITKLGYKVMIDPNIIVGHEKTKIYI